MAITLDGTNGITFNNSTVQASAGSVLQVVQAVSTTQTSATTTYVDATGVTVTITPKFSTSKILVIVSASMYFGNTGGGVQILKNGSVIFNPSPDNGTGPFYIFIAAAIGSPAPITYLDSPATTSALTYKLQFRAYSGTAYVNYASGTNNGGSTITVMEIAG